MHSAMPAATGRRMLGRRHPESGGQIQFARFGCQNFTRRNLCRDNRDTPCRPVRPHHGKELRSRAGIRPVVVHGRPVRGSADGRNRRERRGAAQCRNLHHERRKRHRQNHGRTRRCADPESGKQYGGIRQRGGGN